MLVFVKIYKKDCINSLAQPTFEGLLELAQKLWTESLFYEW